MEIPKTEAEIKEELRKCWHDANDENKPSWVQNTCRTRFKTMGWMLGFKTVDEIVKWAGI